MADTSLAETTLDHTQGAFGLVTETCAIETQSTCSLSDVHSACSNAETGPVAVDESETMFKEECIETDNNIPFTCGGCCSAFPTICKLHLHLREHGSDGSYYYSEDARTAYPKFSSINSFVQTDLSVITEDPTDDGHLIETDLQPVVESKSNIKEIRGRKRKAENVPKVDVKKSLRIPKTKTCNESRTKSRNSAKEKSVSRKTSPKKTRRRSQKAETSLEDKFVKIQGASKVVEEQIEQEERTKKPRKAKEIQSHMTETEEADIDNTNKTNTDQADQPKNITEQKDADTNLIVQNKADHNAGILENVKADLDGIHHSEGEDTETDSVQLHYMTCQQNGEVSPLDCKKIRKKAKKENKKTKETSEKEPKEKKKREKKEDIYQSCETCGEIMLQKKIKAHMVMHTGEKSFICEICGQAYAKNSNLYRHKITHREVKPFRCSLCPAQFCRKKDYTYHLNSHKGYRPHVCNVCDKRFLTNKGLIQHQENIHMGITKFQCDFCERRFFKKSGLFAHRATHFEATLECQYCDRKFRDKCGLNKHERTHMGKKHYQCHVCGHAFNQCTPYYQHMEKRHSMNRGTIKDIMKIVMEAKKRNGEKVDLFVVPDNLDEIVANLNLEDSVMKSKINYVFQTNQNCVKSKLETDLSGNEIVPEQVIPQNSGDNLEQHSLAESILSHSVQGTSIAVTAVENGSVTLNLQTLEPMRSVPLVLKTDDEKKLYSAQSLVDMQGHLQVMQPVENMVLYQLSDQTVESSGLMNLEPVKTLQQSSGHPKQKMKLLSHYAEYQQQKNVPTQPAVQQVTSKMQGIPISVALPTYVQPNVSVAVTGIDPLSDAYTTSDFIERMLDGQ